MELASWHLQAILQAGCYFVLEGLAGGGGGVEGLGRVEGGEGDECGEDDSSSGTFGCY